jgi:hypothetical protein
VVPVTGLADNPEKLVTVHVVFVPGPVIVPEQGLDVSVTAIEFGPVSVSPIVAVELVNVKAVAVVLDCSGITSPPTPVSARTTLVSVPFAGLKSLMVQGMLYGTAVTGTVQVWVIVAADILPVNIMQQIAAANKSVLLVGMLWGILRCPRLT